MLLLVRPDSLILIQEAVMLDGKRYYAVFPDENPEMRDRMRSFFDALKKLERAFQDHGIVTKRIEQLRLRDASDGA